MMSTNQLDPKQAAAEVLVFLRRRRWKDVDPRYLSRG